MSNVPTQEDKPKMISLGRLNKRTKADGTVYYTGNIMLKKLRDCTPFTDKFGNEKIGLVVFENDYYQVEGDATHKVFESRKPENTDATATTKAPAGAKNSDLPF